MTQSQSLQAELGSRVLSFYDFVEGAREVLKSSSVDPSLVDVVKQRVEVSGQSDDQECPPDVTFESALYNDIERISRLFPYLQTFERTQLESFEALISVETGGLTGDLSPREKLSGTLPGVLFAGIGLSVFWFGFWGRFYSIPGGDDIFSLFTDWLKANGIVEAILITVILLGGTVGVFTYMFQTYRNRKQVAFLRSIQRAITLFYLVSDESSGFDDNATIEG